MEHVERLWPIERGVAKSESHVFVSLWFASLNQAFRVSDFYASVAEESTHQ